MTAFCLFLTIACSSPKQAESKRILASDDSTNKIKECEIMKDTLYTYSDTDSSVFCNDDYHLYEAKKFTPSKTKKVKLASFNIYKINNGASRFKNTKLLAKIFNEEKWDMIAVQEIFPMTSDTIIANLEWRNMDDTFKTSKENISSLQVPLYLTLLQDLQKADPKAGWSFILSNVASGATDSTLEHAGFYFKKATLKLIENEYCAKKGVSTENDKKFACMQLLTGFEKEAVSRPPFIASFKASTFDYVALTLHARFRLPKDTNRSGNFDDVLVDKVLKTYLGDNPPELSKEELYRAAELRTVTNTMSEIAELTGEKDIMLMGDFNLEHNKGKDEYVKSISKSNIPELEKMWSLITAGYEGSQVFGLDESSLSLKDRLKSNYDHFIFKPQKSYTSECTDPIVYDFTDAEFKHFKDYRDKNNWPTILSDFENTQKSKKIIIKGKVSDVYNEVSLKKEVLEFKKRMFTSQSSISKKYLMQQELLSDHLPIVSECTSEVDDD